MRCLMLSVVVLLLPSANTAWGFQPTSLTPHHRRTNALPRSSGHKTSPSRHHRYPYPYRPLWYASPKSDNNNNNEPKKDTKKPRAPKNQKSKSGVKESNKTNQSPLNIFNQIFQHLGFPSTAEVQPDELIPPVSNNTTGTAESKKTMASRKKKIVMPKQITTASERATAKASKTKNKPKAVPVSKASPPSPAPAPKPATVPKIKDSPTLPKNEIVLTPGDFQQRLLEASLEQWKKQQQVKKSEPPIVSLSEKYQKSVKHIRVLAELSKSNESNTERKEPSRKKTDNLTGRMASKADVAPRKMPKVVVPLAKSASTKSKEQNQDAAKAKKKQVPRMQNKQKAEPKIPLKPPSLQLQQRLLQTRFESERRAKDLVDAKRLAEALTLIQAKQKKKAKPVRSVQNKAKAKPKTPLKPPSSQLQQRLLQTRFESEKRAKDLVHAKRRQEALIVTQKRVKESQRKQYTFHQSLLAQKNTYDKEESQRKQQFLLAKELQKKAESERKAQLRLEQERVEQEKRELEAKNKRDALFHQSLLVAQFQSVERAKTFKMKRLAQEIFQQKEERRKQKEYQFHRRRLASSLESLKKQKEQEKKDKLNSMLQNSSLMNYTKEKISEKEKQRLEAQEALMEQRLRSKAKADVLKQAEKTKAEALKRAEQARIELEKELAAAAEKRIRDKQNSDFHQELLAKKVRYDLVERKRLAEKRINELHQSLLAAQRESELAAAQVLEAEERKRQAQLELEERKKREEEEERKRQAQLELEEQKIREKEEAEREAKRIEAERRVQQQIKESKEREDAFRRDLENAGRQQAATESDPSAGGMNEYEAILEIQRKQAIQRRIDEGKRQQDELKRTLENAGRAEASEQTMDRYEEILQQQKNEELQRRTEEAHRRQENLRRQLEETGQAKAQDGITSMDQYSEWVEQANITSWAQPDSWKPPQTGTSAGNLIQPRPESVIIEHQPSVISQPDLVSAQATDAQPQQQQQQQNQPDVDPLVGKVLLDKFVIAEKLRVGGDRSELYKCYHVLDKPQQYALVIKLSHNIQQIELEHRIYGDLFSRLSEDRQDLFVRAYDWVPASDLTNGRVGFAMECGLENLRGHIWRHGPYTGDKLRSAMENVIRIVQALHGLGVVWSELKAENFIVFDGEKIKAVDLESVAAHNEFLRAYTAETYPPEFPADSLYQCLPKIPVDYSFDVWGMGLSLYELAVGEPLFTLQRTYDVDYIKERLKNPQGIVDEANKKLWKVEAGARNIIRQCLVVDPSKRSSCNELLQDPYFTNARQSNPPAFSPTANFSI